ncbi:MAG: hypothetical protein V1777_03165 [Candidatus Micrarchaeota archaeon]
MSTPRRPIIRNKRLARRVVKAINRGVLKAAGLTRQQHIDELLQALSRAQTTAAKNVIKNQIQAIQESEPQRPGLQRELDTLVTARKQKQNAAWDKYWQKNQSLFNDYLKNAKFPEAILLLEEAGKYAKTQKARAFLMDGWQETGSLLLKKINSLENQKGKRGGAEQPLRYLAGIAFSNAIILAEKNRFFTIADELFHTAKSAKLAIQTPSNKCLSENGVKGILAMKQNRFDVVFGILFKADEYAATRDDFRGISYLWKELAQKIPHAENRALYHHMEATAWENSVQAARKSGDRELAQEITRLAVQNGVQNIP